MADPELHPSADEPPVIIGPNRADNQELCKAVLEHVTTAYWYPYLLLQQRFWPAWEKIDRAWRGRFDILDATPATSATAALKQNSPWLGDGRSASGQSVMFFRQCHAITDIGEQMSFEQGVPIRAEVPEEVDEDDFYRPTEQSVIAANSIFRMDADKFSTRDEWRKSFGGYVKYGTSWALLDFRKSTEMVELRFPLSQNPQETQAQAQEVQSRHPAAPVQVEMTPQGLMALASKQEIRLHTVFRHLRIDDVFIDPLISCEPVERQPCPIIREHVTALDIEQSPYDAEKNPFGYLNAELARTETEGHYALSEQSESPLRAQLQTRYGISDSVTLTTQQIRVQQKWTAYPWLRIGPEGDLDNGKALDNGGGCLCPRCKGDKRLIEVTTGEEIPCPDCEGVGKVRVPAKRYVVVFFGAPRFRTVCLRIQELPEGMRVPLLYAPDLVEDDSCAVPMSSSEISLMDIEKVTRAEVLLEHSFQSNNSRKFKYKDEGPAADLVAGGKDLSNINIPFENSAEEVVRVESNMFDDSPSQMAYIERCDSRIQQIKGATETLLGQLASGRRSAMEIGQATEAAKNPLVLLVDRFNRRMMGGWGRATIDNLEAFGDRDYIRRKTGRPWFGKVRITTSAGSDFVKKMAMANDLRWWLQAIPTLPQLMPILPQIANQLLKVSGITGIVIPDGGIRKATNDAMIIITQILGDGVPVPALPTDPHELYIDMFTAAIKDPYWADKFPQNLELMGQRLLQQQYLLNQQMELQLRQQATEAALQQAAQPQKQGNRPPGPTGAKPTPGGAQQAAQG